MTRIENLKSSSERLLATAVFASVPRFHFHTEDGDRIDDVDGTELPDLNAAKDTAVKVLAQALDEERHDFWTNECLRVIVSDDDDLTLFSLDLSVTRSPAAPRLGGQGRKPLASK